MDCSSPEPVNLSFQDQFYFEPLSLDQQYEQPILVSSTAGEECAQGWLVRLLVQVGGRLVELKPAYRDADVELNYSTNVLTA